MTIIHVVPRKTEPENELPQKKRLPLGFVVVNQAGRFSTKLFTLVLISFFGLLTIGLITGFTLWLTIRLRYTPHGNYIINGDGTGSSGDSKSPIGIPDALDSSEWRLGRIVEGFDKFVALVDREKGWCFLIAVNGSAGMSMKDTRFLVVETPMEQHHLNRTAGQRVMLMVIDRGPLENKELADFGDAIVESCGDLRSFTLKHAKPLLNANITTTVENS